MQTIELNKKVTSIEVQGDKIIINLEQDYIPKDGEYFYVKTKANYKFIAIKKEGEYITSRYFSYGIKLSTIGSGDGWITTDDQIKEIRPATKEERARLDKALEEKGKRWNPETKQIEELPKVGDFCIFWDDDKSLARCGVLFYIIAGDYCLYRINYGVFFKNCIPFQSAEHFQEFIKG